MQRGLGVVCKAAAPLYNGAPWGWGCDKPGVGWEVRGILKWCWEVRRLAVKLVGMGAAEASPLEIVKGAPLEREGEWVGGGGILWVCGLRPVLEEVAEFADGV